MMAQWELINLDMQSASAATRRCARAIRWLYATGLRRAELTGALCGNLERLEIGRLDGISSAGWLLTLRGKGGAFDRCRYRGLWCVNSAASWA